MVIVAHTVAYPEAMVVISLYAGLAFLAVSAPVGQ